MTLSEAKRIMQLVAKGNECNRAWEGQDEAAKVILAKLKRLEKRKEAPNEPGENQ